MLLSYRREPGCVFPVHHVDLSLTDAQDARVAGEALDEGFSHVAHAPEYLDGGVGHLTGYLCGEVICHGELGRAAGVTPGEGRALIVSTHIETHVLRFQVAINVLVFVQTIRWSGDGFRTEKIQTGRQIDRQRDIYCHGH